MKYLLSKLLAVLVRTKTGHNDWELFQQNYRTKGVWQGREETPYTMVEYGKAPQREFWSFSRACDWRNSKTCSLMRRDPWMTMYEGDKHVKTTSSGFL